MQAPLRVALLGFGTVGQAVARVLERNAREIRMRAGREIVVLGAAVRQVEKPRAFAAGFPLLNDPLALATRPEVDIVVELMGGVKEAGGAILAALDTGKHVVTANKALLAASGNAIFARALERGLMVGFEAAVAGGIPIIKSLREGLAANRIEEVTGILNGTCNSILTSMSESGLSFAAALAEAQRLGYAEADPVLDVEGWDAAQKLSILVAIAFGMPIVPHGDISTEGIARISPKDIRYARDLGFAVKLLAIGRQTEDGVELRVHPALVPEGTLFANVKGAMNAVLVRGDAVGETVFYGPGAGGEPTASSVVADIIEITRMATADPQNRVPHLAFQPQWVEEKTILPEGTWENERYFRFHVVDEPGVLAEITAILAHEGISIEAVQQKGAMEDRGVDVVVLAHRSLELAARRALVQIMELPRVLEAPVHLRVERLEGRAALS